MDEGGRMEHEGELIFYQVPEGEVRVDMLYELKPLRMNHKGIAQLFGGDVRTVSYRLKKVYDSGELTPEATLRKIRIVDIEGNREVSREIEFYNLDAMISVGCSSTGFRRKTGPLGGAVGMHDFRCNRPAWRSSLRLMENLERSKFSTQRAENCSSLQKITL